MTKVLLLRPPELYGKTSFAQFYTLHESLGTGYLASYLRKHGHSVHILDAHIEDLSVDETIEKIVGESFDILGITIGSSLVMPQVIQIIQGVKAKKTQIHITLGGHYPTFCYDHLLIKNPNIDSIVRFEGEETLLELVQAIANGTVLDDVKGIAFRKLGKIEVTPPRPLVSDLDSLPFPARDTLPALLKRGGLPLISGSRGCPARCSFCSVHSFYNEPSGKIWRARSIDNIIEEIKFLQNDFNCRELWFVDDNFLGFGSSGRKRARNLFVALDQEELHIDRLDFSCRADSIAKEPDLLKLAYENRRGLVYPGIEAGVQRILDLYQKGTTVEDNRVAVKAIKESQADIKMEFILFNPWITFTEIKETINFLEDVGVYDPYILTSTLTIMRHTSLAASIEKGVLKVKPLPSEQMENFDTDSFIPYQIDDEQVGILFHLVTNTLPQLEYVLSAVHNLGKDARLKYGENNSSKLSEVEESCQDLTQLINETSLDIFKEAMGWVEKVPDLSDEKLLAKFQDSLIEKTIMFARSLSGIIAMEQADFFGEIK